MKKLLIAISVILFFSAFNYPQKQQALFNGKDLSGWKVYGTEKWYVEDGLLVCESGADKKSAPLS
jgi:hypothetical protein